jgi:hypothetical protein
MHTFIPPRRLCSWSNETSEQWKQTPNTRIHRTIIRPCPIILLTIIPTQAKPAVESSDGHKTPQLQLMVSVQTHRRSILRNFHWSNSRKAEENNGKCKLYAVVRGVISEPEHILSQVEVRMYTDTILQLRLLLFVPPSLLALLVPTTSSVGLKYFQSTLTLARSRIWVQELYNEQ